MKSLKKNPHQDVVIRGKSWMQRNHAPIITAKNVMAKVTSRKILSCCTWTMNPEL
ncbi:unnamed protein product [Notodromas monacha]|uniref:Uncharacterized protein n=1 Tax=Notodromas monacha TaxID=399045 RepID=A0A7R9C356_9CRUS|nr:unnamed protein product [Notodromas monacha]CAG0926064.1 unnamed protein product [Notodromas monacha]